jgi:hypothetical protein
MLFQETVGWGIKNVTEYRKILVKGRERERLDKKYFQEKCLKW